jgi:L-lactate dehydrogenase complex protein LldF
MATQEIGLNEALEAAGIAAWETDLAELIVQLGHDKPSHILVPAIHRNRSEIRDIFRREMPGLGTELDPGMTDDPRELAMTARRHLRRTFLRARVAVSGANFAVGGDRHPVGRRVRGQRPDVPHAAADADHRHGHREAGADLDRPRGVPPAAPAVLDRRADEPLHLDVDRVTPGDGPQEFHLVLLDNGATAVLADEVGREALHCIRCSACLNVCPVYERDGRARLRLGLPGPDRRDPVPAC